jgi:Ca2+-binding EF-hand superfamily protein
MKKLITILAALAVTAAFATAADEPKKEAAKGEKKAGANPEERFKKLDTNSDGFIDLAEFKASPAGQKDAAKAEEFFKKKDTNSDGKLSPEEFNAAGAKKPK